MTLVLSSCITYQTDEGVAITREVNYFKKDPPGAWAKDAACRGLHGTHFPDAPVNTVMYARQVAYAKMICARCPVIAECFALAMSNSEQIGIWGGEVFPNGARAHRRRLKKLAS